MDQNQWMCNNNHVVEEGKQATPYPECRDTLEDRLNAYLTTRLASLADVQKPWDPGENLPGTFSRFSICQAHFGENLALYTREQAQSTLKHG